MDTFLLICSHCGAENLRNIVTREATGLVVYADCPRCGRFLARFLLGSFHQEEQEVQAYLEAQRGDAGEDVRALLAGASESRAAAESGYRDALERLNESRNPPESSPS